MKRTSKKPRASAARSPKLPDELHPIVDSVVEVVFERLRAAGGTTKKPAAHRSAAKIDLPLPKQRKALAEALADLLLADLAKRTAAKGKGKQGVTRRSEAKKGSGAKRGAPAAKKARVTAAKMRSKRR